MAKFFPDNTNKVKKTGDTMSGLLRLNAGADLDYGQFIRLGPADNNWRLGLTLSSHPITSAVITGNRINIGHGGGANDGVVIGVIGGNSTFELKSDNSAYLRGKLDSGADTIRLRTAKTPASATDTGNAGDIAWDANYVYVCIATNTWKRTAIATW